MADCSEGARQCPKGFSYNSIKLISITPFEKGQTLGYIQIKVLVILN